MFQSYEENSLRCSGHGTLKCGRCECDIGYSGDDCNCTSDADKIDKCRPGTSGSLCSDHGVCKCNKCYCNSYSPNEVRVKNIFQFNLRYESIFY